MLIRASSLIARIMTRSIFVVFFIKTGYFARFLLGIGTVLKTVGKKKILNSSDALHFLLFDVRS